MGRVGFVVAVVVMLATAVGASAATPEFYNVNGKLPSNAKVSFTMEGAFNNWSTAGLLELECRSSEGTGEINGATKIKHMVITYRECRWPSALTTCESEPPAEGTIVTKSLEGELVYLKKASGLPVGVRLQPESGTEVTNLHCTFYSTEVTGSIIAEVPAGSVNKLSLKVNSNSNRRLRVNSDGPKSK